jgi:hypothetical protein
MVKIEDILASEPVILVDGSISDSGGICKKIYDTWLYSQLNANDLREAISEIQCFEKILSAENVYTIHHVAMEIKEFERIINDKIKGMVPLKIPSFYRGYDKLIRPRNCLAIKEKGEEARASLYGLQRIAYSVRRLAEHSEISRFAEFKDVGDDIYPCLLEMTKAISSQLWPDDSNGYLADERQKKRHSDTDERLVVTAYRLSMMDKSCCVMSNDKDFVTLFGVVTRAIGADIFLPYNSIFREKVKQNPFKLYFLDPLNKKYELKADSSNMDLYEHFLIKNVSRRKNHEIGELIFDSWKKIWNILEINPQLETVAGKFA